MNRPPKSQRVQIVFNLIACLLFLTACVSSPAAPTSIPQTEEIAQTEGVAQATAEIANPASVYCKEQGGNTVIVEKADGSQSGLCIFDDNRQCEEWAMLRGECPVGGVEVSHETVSDPLPSWNDGPAKTTILQFVVDVTDPAKVSYVAPEERIAVFDNDGTLWTEKPVPVQEAYISSRIKEMAAEHPEWQTTQPYQALLEKDIQALAAMSEEDIEKLVSVTHADMTIEEYMNLVKSFLDTAMHPRFNVPYTDTVYQPMLELLALLRTNGFKNFIVSGGGADFMRTFSEPVYSIPMDNVIGSSVQYTLSVTQDSAVLLRTPEVFTFNNAEMKPVNIQHGIGRRPILAAGNSDGDLAMFQYTGANQKPSLILLIVHDDAEREYDYLEGTDAVMTATAQSPWMFVSMKRDFATMFPFESDQ